LKDSIKIISDLFSDTMNKVLNIKGAPEGLKFYDLDMSQGILAKRDGLYN
jgi:hypothetical protein